ncbi:MAG TPA: hypothetical protein VLS90_13080 [Thermodesulfobacteriota bacterium]|nr:hypothetical protein [Thermodesulfobacteriota bacterium]
MTLWEAIKKGAEEGLEALKDSVSVLMAETEKTRRILKKRVELTSVQSSVRRTFTRLGSLAYDLHVKGEADQISADPEFRRLVAQVEEYKAKVRDIETEIETIKREEKQKSSEGGPQPPANQAG